MLRHLRPAAFLPAAAVVLAALAGCSSGTPTQDAGPAVPAVEDFAAGDCALAAPDVRAVGELLPRLGDDGEVEPEVRDGLRLSQERVRAIAETADAGVQPALQELSLALGLVRIRADGNTYEPELGEGLRSAYEQVVQVCTG